MLADQDPYGVYDDISPRRRAVDRAVMGALASVQALLAGHWLFLLNMLIGLYVGLALLSPLLKAAGFVQLGDALFAAYFYACHQLPQRSFFIFGHQVAFCQRDVALYGSMCLAGLIYAARRRRVRPLRWWLYLIAITPIVVDGGTQLIGLRESTWELRVATGALFGVATVWLVYPHLDLTVDELVGRGAAGPGMDTADVLSPRGKG